MSQKQNPESTPVYPSPHSVEQRNDSDYQWVLCFYPDIENLYFQVYSCMWRVDTVRRVGVGTSTVRSGVKGG